MKKLLSLVVTCLCISTMAVAGGSAHRDDIRALIEPSVLKDLDSAYQFSEVGSCLRLPSGKRLLPCEIQATDRDSGAKVLIKFNAKDDVAIELL